MHFKDWFRAPRHLLVLFFGITTISAATLGWLSLQIVRQDRALAVQRAQEQRDNAADAAVALLQKSLSGLERDLSSIATAGDDTEGKAQEYSQNLSKGAVILILRPDSLQAYPARRLLFYPVTSGVSSVNKFSVADELEFNQRDYNLAIEVLRVSAQSHDPRVKAEALIRLARNVHKTKRTHDALAIYEQVSELRDIEVHGIPADLIGRSKVCALLAELGDADRLQREALVVYNDLQNGRWRLTRPVYDVYVEQARQILGSTVPPNEDLPSARLVTDAAYELWNRAAERLSEGRVTLWISDQPVLAITRRIGDRLLALIVGPEQLTSLLQAVQQAAGERSSEIVLTDAQEHPVAGSLTNPPGSYAVRLTSATGLPWTVYATSRSGAADAAYARRGRFVIAGLFAIALLVLGGSYLIGRAVARELAVATLICR